MQRFLQKVFQDSMLALLCVSQALFLLVAVVASALRLGRNRRRFLPLKAVPIPHAVLIVLLMVPLMSFVNSLAWYATQYWELLLLSFPALKRVAPDTSSMDVIADLAADTPLPLLFVLIAFVPAVAEELVFRGVIGRGLVARWGLGMGVLITSVLFAAIHLHPVHAFALIPLAVCIHLAYLSTRSFWAPMAIHFINNAVAVVVIWYILENPELVAEAENAEPSLLVYLAAGACIVTLTAILWQMRVQYIRPDGTQWDPGYEGADIPPATLGATKVFALPDWRLLVACGVSGAAFVVALVLTSLEAAAEAA